MTPYRNEKQADNTLPFEFHSNFWVNLHHYLYLQADLRKRATNSGQTTGSTVTIDQLTVEQQQLWNSALDYYVSKLVGRNLVFDEDLVAINDRLAELEEARNLNNRGLHVELTKVLESVAPIYKARWWPEHDKTNRFWIAVVTPMVRQFSQPLIKQLSTAYKAQWPANSIRVDVSVYASWYGAYTIVNNNKVHTTICSYRPDYQGFAALEMLFHEASHSMVDENKGAVGEVIARECRAKNKQVPKELWHAIIFYTAGELTKRNLNEFGVSEYIPYANSKGLYKRAWPKYERPLELYWKPYLDGKVDFDKAITDLVEGL